jgi:hypothetical protein
VTGLGADCVELIDLDVLVLVLVPDAVMEVDLLDVEPPPVLGVWLGGQDTVVTEE